MKNITALLIDVKAKEIREVEMDTNYQPADYLDYGSLEYVPIKDGDSMVMDGVARQKPKSEIEGAFIYKQKYAIMNSALVLGHTPKGNRRSPKMTIDELRELVQFEDMV